MLGAVGARGTPVTHPWGTWIVASPVPNSNPLYQFDGQVRLCHLYTGNDQTELYLEIFSDGTVRGSKYKNLFSLMEIKAVKVGIISIMAKKTSRFLCMDSEGHLYSSLSYSEEFCNFQEKLRHGYNVYYSEAYSLPLSLNVMENLAHSHQLPPFSQFLPLRKKAHVEPTHINYEYVQPRDNTDSSDPFNIFGQNQDVRSLSFGFR
ncbi:fibroblast growth factor 21 [Vipera latastei]